MDIKLNQVKKLSMFKASFVSCLLIFTPFMLFFVFFEYKELSAPYFFASLVLSMIFSAVTATSQVVGTWILGFLTPNMVALKTDENTTSIAKVFE